MIRINLLPYQEKAKKEVHPVDAYFL